MSFKDDRGTGTSEEAPSEFFTANTAAVSFSAPTRVVKYDAQKLAEGAAHEARAPSLEPFQRFGNFQILEKLGEGGMAEVYLARHGLGHGVEKLVALKLVKREFAVGTALGDMVLNEARISVTLQHPNVVQVFDFGAIDGRQYLTMEYLPGWNLARLIHELRRLGMPPPLYFVTAIAFEAARGLEYLHDKVDLDGRPMNLVHRDVTPANILVSDTGQIKLLDFGVAAAAFAQNPAAMQVGTTAYMSPEQALCAEPSPRWDIYSLGVVLHELLTLERLFMGVTEPGALGGKRAQTLAPSCSNPNVPAELDEIVLRATDADPGRRYQSATEMRVALEVALHGLQDDEASLEAVRVMATDATRRRGAVEALVTEARQRTAELVPPAPEPVPEPVAPPPPENSTPAPVAAAPIQVQTPAAVPVAQPPPPQRSRLPLWLGAVALVAIAGASFGWTRMSSAQQAETDAQSHLELARQRMVGGQLAGPNDDTALGHLLAAQRLIPGDPRIQTELQTLADTFMTLGEAALRRKDLGEAMVHFEAALKADPNRDAARKKLEQINAEARASQTVRHTP